MVAIYARVSTKKQEKDGYSLPEQVRLGTVFADGRGDSCQSYVEARSGKHLKNRTEWRRLETDIEAGQIKTVWIMDNDRLARDQLDSQLMLRFMKDHDIEFWVGSKCIDFNNSDDMMVFQVTQAISEKTGKDIVRKSTIGIHASKDAGDWANVRLYGYERVFDEKGKAHWVTVKEQVAALRRMFALYVEGMSIRQITARLEKEGYQSWAGGTLKPANVNRALKNPRYVGMIPNTRGELVKSNVYEPVIDRRTWETARKRVLLNPSRSFRVTANHLVSGVLRCARCGKSFYHHERSLINGQRRNDESYLHDSHGVKCGQHPARLSSRWLGLLFQVIYMISIRDTRSIAKLYAEESKKITRRGEQIERDGQRIEGRITELSKKKQRLVSAIANGAIAEEDAGGEIRKINAEVIKLERAKIESRRELTFKQDRTELLLREFSAQSFYKFTDEKSTDRERRDMLRRIIETAVIEGRQITVKVVSGKMFTLTYRPREEKAAVKYLAGKAGVDVAVLGDNETLEGLLAEVVSQGMTQATAVGIEVTGGKRGKLGSSVLEG